MENDVLSLFSANNEIALHFVNTNNVIPLLTLLALPNEQTFDISVAAGLPLQIQTTRFLHFVNNASV